jgi:hypothetical protein
MLGTFCLYIFRVEDGDIRFRRKGQISSKLRGDIPKDGIFQTGAQLIPVLFYTVTVLIVGFVLQQYETGVHKFGLEKNETFGFVLQQYGTGDHKFGLEKNEAVKCTLSVFS